MNQIVDLSYQSEYVQKAKQCINPLKYEKKNWEYTLYLVYEIFNDADHQLDCFDRLILAGKEPVKQVINFQIHAIAWKSCSDSAQQKATDGCIIQYSSGNLEALQFQHVKSLDVSTDGSHFARQLHQFSVGE